MILTIDDILELLLMVGIQGQIRSSNVTIGCPFAAVSGHRSQIDRHPSLGFKPIDDLERGAIWNCFTCGRKGPIRKFFLDLGFELNYNNEAVLRALDGKLKKAPEALAEYIPAYDAHFQEGDPEEMENYRTFPESWLGPYVGSVPKYILNRGITLQTCKEFEIGWDKDLRRVIFPVRDHRGLLAGAVGGLTVKVQNQPKYKNYWHRVHTCGYPVDHKDGKYRCESCGRVIPEVEALDGFRKQNLVYGEHKLSGCIAVIVEGIIDCLRVYQATRGLTLFNNPVMPVALFGSDPARRQINKIVRLTAERMVIGFLDNDLAGTKGDQEIRELIDRRVRYFRAVYPSSTNPDDAVKDPGDMEDGQIRETLKSSEIVFTSRR